MTATSLVRYDRPDVVEVERSRSWVELMGPAVELAKAIAGTAFVPRDMRDNPAAISAAILYGDEVGLGPMQSLATVKVIEGTPTLLAKTQRALVLAAGHAIWPDELSTERATWAGRRAGEDQVTRVTWTMDDARKANLAGKPNYRNYPRQMLSARASAELVGAIFSDVVAGLAATEEFETEADAESRDSVAGESGTRRRTRRRRGAGVAAVPPALASGGDAPTGLPPLPGETDDAPRDRMTDAQRRRMMAQFARLGYRGNTAEVRARRLELTREVVGRPELESSRDLTEAEAERVIGYLDTYDDDQAVDGELVDEQNRAVDVAGDTDTEGA